MPYHLVLGVQSDARKKDHVVRSESARPSHLMANGSFANGVSFTETGKKVGVVGATGAVGMEMIHLLFARNFPLKELRLFASARSVGKKVKTTMGLLEIEEFSVEKAREMDIVFLAVSGQFSLNFAKQITASPGGAIVIDNSSAWRLHADVPLVIPEINGHRALNASLIANPNCTTAIAAMALWPIHCQYGLSKVIMSTYQAASGAGQDGMEELRIGTDHHLLGRPLEPTVFAHPLPFNVIPHIDKFQDNLYTKEEMKVTWETRKIFEDTSLQVSCTAVRVPTMRAHAESITIKTEDSIKADEARRLLSVSPGVRVVDLPSENIYPMPLTATEKNDVEVGRIRQSLVFGNHGLDLFVCGDQLLRGAALNAVLIAEHIEHPGNILPKLQRRRKSICARLHETAWIVGATAAAATAVFAIRYAQASHH